MYLNISSDRAAQPSRLELSTRISHAYIELSRFSRVTGGRNEGNYSGRAFRDEVLVPALGRYTIVTLDLNGVEGIACSFLDEVFGGLVEKGGFDQGDLMARLKIVSDLPSDHHLVWEYISGAQALNEENDYFVRNFS
jgi:hypothetical protein